jgi:glycosyltransferase involved in cell wall biosynthesis
VRLLLAATSTLPDRMGGGERVLWHLARGMRERGHEVRIVVPRTTPEHPLVSVVDGVRIVRYDDRFHSFCSFYAVSIWLARRAIRHLLDTWSPDVVHANQALAGLGALAAGVDRLDYTFYGPWHLEFLTEVTHRREMSPLKRATRGVWAPTKAMVAARYERAAMRRSHRLVVLSTFSVRQLAEVHGMRPANLAVIPGGVDLALFRPSVSRAEARAVLGLPADGPLLFSVRRLVPRMGLARLIEALPDLPGVGLVIAGTGWLRPHLEERARSVGVADRVRFVGFVPDGILPLYYQAADLVALPSVTLEGFGLITLEALASGTPVVATPDSGTTDILGPWEPEWVAKNATAAELARCIAGVLPRARADGAIRAHCRARALDWSWDRMVAAHERLYRGEDAAW